MNICISTHPHLQKKRLPDQSRVSKERINMTVVGLLLIISMTLQGSLSSMGHIREPDAYWFAIVGPQESGLTPHLFYYNPHIMQKTFKTRLAEAVQLGKRQGWMGSTDYILFLKGNRIMINTGLTSLPIEIRQNKHVLNRLILGPRLSAHFGLSNQTNLNGINYEVYNDTIRDCRNFAHIDYLTVLRQYEIANITQNGLLLNCVTFIPARVTTDFRLPKKIPDILPRPTLGPTTIQRTPSTTPKSPTTTPIVTTFTPSTPESQTLTSILATSAATPTSDINNLETVVTRRPTIFTSTTNTSLMTTIQYTVSSIKPVNQVRTTNCLLFNPTTDIIPLTSEGSYVYACQNWPVSRHAELFDILAEAFNPREVIIRLDKGDTYFYHSLFIKGREHLEMVLKYLYPLPINVSLPSWYTDTTITATKKMQQKATTMLYYDSTVWHEQSYVSNSNKLNFCVKVIILTYILAT